MSIGRPSFLEHPKVDVFDDYRQPRYADIVVELYQDYSSQVYDPGEIRLLLQVHIDDGNLTESQAKDIEQMVLGGLPIPVVEGRSFPDELFIADGLIGGIIEWIVSRSHRRQPVMAQMMALALVATAAARKVTTPGGIHPNLYQIIVSPSSGGKDGPRQAAFELMSYAGGDALMGTESVTSATAIISQLQVSPSLLLPIDEIGKVISGIKSKNASGAEKEIETLLLKLWSSPNNRRFKHKGFAKIEDNVEIVRPNVSLFGTSVFDTLFGQGAMDKTSVVDGFLSRCIVYDTGDDVPPTCSPVHSDPPASIVAPLAAWIDFKPSGELGWEIDPREKVTTFSPEAERAIRAATVRWDILGDRLPSEHGASLYRRCAEKARKYALVYAISEHTPADDIVIERRHADWAVAVISWLTDRFLGIVKDKVVASAREQQLMEILTFIRSKKSAGATYRDILRRFRGMTVKVRDDLVADLILSGDVCGTDVATPGRPRNTLWAAEYFQASLLSAKPGDGSLPARDASLAV